MYFESLHLFWSEDYFLDPVSPHPHFPAFSQQSVPEAIRLLLPTTFRVSEALFLSKGHFLLPCRSPGRSFPFVFRGSIAKISVTGRGHDVLQHLPLQTETPAARLRLQSIIDRISVVYFQTHGLCQFNIRLHPG